MRDLAFDATIDADNEADELTEKLHTYFAGKIVRKDLTKKLKRAQMFPFMSWNTCLACIVLRAMRMK